MKITKTTKKSVSSGNRSAMTKRDSSGAPRKAPTRKGEPENHTRLMGGKSGHVMY